MIPLEPPSAAAGAAPPAPALRIDFDIIGWGVVGAANACRCASWLQEARTEGARMAWVILGSFCSSNRSKGPHTHKGQTMATDGFVGEERCVGTRGKRGGRGLDSFLPGNPSTYHRAIQMILLDHTGPLL